MVLDKVENTPEFQEAFNSLKEAYSKITDSEGRILYNKDSADFDNMIKQEAVADYLGENLGNQEYINELVNGKGTRNIAQKIYDAIVNFLDKVTGYKSEEAYLRGLKNKFEKAFNAEYTNQGENIKYSVEKTSDGIVYIRSEENAFVKEDGRKMTPREAYTLIEGTTLEIADGDKIKILNHLDSIDKTKTKGLYSELFKRRPNVFKNINDINDFNQKINYNILELLENSQNISSNENDKGLRHQEFGVKGFDTREINLFDGDNAYRIELSIAILDNGEKVAYAKKYAELNQDLTKKIKAENSRGNNSRSSNQPLSKLSITNSNENVNTTKYSMQENENNAGKWQEFLDKNSINNGTKTTLGELKLPQKKEVKTLTAKDTVLYRTEKNMKKYPNAMKMPIEEILKYKTRGGYRTEEQISKLEKDIKENGIDNPIELIRNEDGKIEINNGNHRLEVAQKLGLDEVPVIYKDYADVDNIDENMYDVSEKLLIKRMEAYNDRNNRNSGETNINDGRMWTEPKNSISNRNELKNRETTTRDDRVFGEIQENNDRPSSTATFTKNIKEELEQPSSFSIEQNIDNVYNNSESESVINGK